MSALILALACIGLPVWLLRRYHGKWAWQRTSLDRVAVWLARIFTFCGVALVPWIWVLIDQLNGQAGKRSFDSSWIGLDVLEACCLLGVARLIRRRHRATSPVAAFTAAVLTMDAWFDYMSAAPQLSYAEAMAMACFAELPLSLVLGWVAWKALDWTVAAHAEPGQSQSPVRRASP
jgi:hypothetical protein